MGNENMKMKWNISPIHKIFKIKSGNFLPKSKQIVSGNFEVYGGNGITGYFNNSNIDGENIVIGRVGAKCGNVRLIKGKIWLTDNAFYISEFLIDIDKKYLSLFLSNFDLGKTANQAAQPVISYKGIKDIKVPLPPLPEQRAIVARLDALFERIDAAIALVKENIAHTEALMGSVLDEEFGRLEDNYGKQELDSIIRVINGRAYKKPELLPKGKYLVLRVGNFFTNKNYYYSDLELNDDKYCEKGDLLYAWSASFGPKIWDGDKVIYHYHIWKMEPRSDQISKVFYNHLLDWDTEKIKQEHSRGVGMFHITKGMIEKREIVVPPLIEQEKAVKRIESKKNKIQNVIDKQSTTLTYLNGLKQSLLDVAFKGELV